MNRVILLGRIAQDLELLPSKSDIPYMRFAIAVDREWKKKNKDKDYGSPDADFIPCMAFGAKATFIHKYFRKGTRILVEGAWQIDKINKDGKTRNYSICMVKDAHFADGKTTKNNSTDPSELAIKEPDSKSDFMEIPDNIDSDLPFY